MGDESGQILGGRFEVVRELGAGGQGRAFLARDLEGGGEVVVKECLLGRVGDWKSVELFEREGAALKNVRHAQVPAYVDAFVGGDDGRFYLVQAFVDGEDLQARIDGGQLMDEGEAVGFLEQMLGVLGYLHGLSPPVIHRDLKPSNVMRRGDGVYVLIDFGAVQSVMTDRGGGSTIVGTSGYMAPEQLMGRAVASSDLYSLAATVVHAVVGMRPSALPMRRLRLDFREVAGLSDGLSDVLERMLAPEMRDRFGSAGEVLAALDVLRVGRSLVEPVRGKLVSNKAGSYRPSAKMRALLKNNPVEGGLCEAGVEDGVLRIDVRTQQSSVWGRRLLWVGVVLASLVVFWVLWLGQIAVAAGVSVVFLIALGWIEYRSGSGAAHEVLKMGEGGIEITKYGLGGKLVWEKSLPYEEIDRMYVDYVGRHGLESRHGGRLSSTKALGQPSHGIVWMTHRRGRRRRVERYLFGNEALSKRQKVTGGSVNLQEFEWMNALITRYWADVVAEKLPLLEKGEAVTLGFGVDEARKKEVTVDARS